MLDELNYDQEDKTSTETNTLKMTEYFINKFVISKMPSELAAENIKSHLSELSLIESDQNCIPAHIAEKHINLALSYFINNRSSAPNKSKIIPSTSPLYDASSWISIFEVVHNVLLAFECGYFSIDIKFNASREKFLEHLFCTALGGKNMTPKQPWTSTSASDIQIIDHNPYTTMFVFDSGDLDAAAHCVSTSIDDPLIPWRVRSIYVQETCYESFCSKLKTKLRGYPAEILRDYAFVEDFHTSMEDLKKMKVNVIQPNGISGDIIPTICCELGREYFDKNGKLSPIIVLKSIRTVKEGITLAKRETGGLASIWTHNISLAYEIVNNSDFTTFWINCLGQLQKSIPFTLRLDRNCIGSDLASLEWFIGHSYIDGKELQSEDQRLLDALKSGTKIENNYHFEYFVTKPNETGKICQQKKDTSSTGGDAFADLVDLSSPYWNNLSVIAAQWKRKTVVFPFGVTFAN